MFLRHESGQSEFVHVCWSSTFLKSLYTCHRFCKYKYFLRISAFFYFSPGWELIKYGPWLLMVLYALEACPCQSEFVGVFSNSRYLFKVFILLLHTEQTCMFYIMIRANLGFYTLMAAVLACSIVVSALRGTALKCIGT